MKLSRALAGVLAIIATSGCQPPHTAPLEDGAPGVAYTLADSWIDFLILVDETRVMLGTSNSGPGGPQAAMTTNRTAVTKVRAAVALLPAPAQYAPQAKAREVVEHGRRFGDLLLAGLNEAFELQRRVVASDDPREIRALPSDLAELTGRLGTVWRTLPLQAALVSHILVDDRRPPDGKLAYLRITFAERSKLIAKLDAAFPSDGKSAKTARSTPEVSASLLLDFLRSEFRSADTVLR